MAGDVEVTLGDDHVAVMEMRRPPNNYFDTALIGALADECERLAASTTCRAIVLCSEGKHFCAGANFGAPAGAGDTHLYDEAIRLFAQPLPIIAAVQGAAIGGGLGVAMVADFRIAAPEARFTANFARLGFHHGFGLSVTLPRVVGRQAALDLLYTGKRIDGEEAVRIGLADRLAAAESLRAEAHAYAVEVAISAPLAVRSIRETMRAGLVDELRDALEREKSEQDRLRRTSDFREGVRATAERRPPNFTGS